MKSWADVDPNSIFRVFARQLVCYFVDNNQARFCVVNIKSHARNTLYIYTPWCACISLFALRIRVSGQRQQRRCVCVRAPGNLIRIKSLSERDTSEHTHTSMHILTCGKFAYTRPSACNPLAAGCTPPTSYIERARDDKLTSTSQKLPENTRCICGN